MDVNGSTKSDRGRKDADSLVDDELDAERTPRWVKAFGIIALILVLIVVVIHLAGGGFHSHF